MEKPCYKRKTLLVVGRTLLLRHSSLGYIIFNYRTVGKVKLNNKVSQNMEIVFPQQQLSANSDLQLHKQNVLHVNRIGICVFICIVIVVIYGTKCSCIFLHTTNEV